MRYWYKTGKVYGNETCLEDCKVKDCKIGSIACQKCRYLKDSSLNHSDRKTERWIVCEKIEEATDGKED